MRDEGCSVCFQILSMHRIFLEVTKSAPDQSNQIRFGVFKGKKHQLCFWVESGRKAVRNENEVVFFFKAIPRTRWNQNNTIQNAAEFDGNALEAKIWNMRFAPFTMKTSNCKTKIRMTNLKQSPLTVRPKNCNCMDNTANTSGFLPQSKKSIYTRVSPSSVQTQPSVLCLYLTKVLTRNWGEDAETRTTARTVIDLRVVLIQLCGRQAEGRVGPKSQWWTKIRFTKCWLW